MLLWPVIAEGIALPTAKRFFAAVCAGEVSRGVPTSPQRNGCRAAPRHLEGGRERKAAGRGRASRRGQSALRPVTVTRRNQLPAPTFLSPSDDHPKLAVPVRWSGFLSRSPTPAELNFRVSGKLRRDPH
jgi:hypothetical protein